MKSHRAWRQFAAFLAGAAAATLVADGALMATSHRPPPAQGMVHHLEFLATLVALVAIAGAVCLRMPRRWPRRRG